MSQSIKFPEGFKWGVASSSYQVEGAHDADGKGPSNWDVYTHITPSKVVDESNGDVACDSYHLYKDDVQLIKNINAKVYRFSVSWPRILPHGTTAIINMAGIQYYNSLIDELIKNDIEPIVTLFHWDTPSEIEDDWLNENIPEYFRDYAKLCFQHFGDRVKCWITLNEPVTYAIHSFSSGLLAPGIKDQMVFAYICGHNMLKAHALVYRAYEQEFKRSQKGRIGISLDSYGHEPFDKESKDDVHAVERAYQFQFGWFGHPIFKGDYPDIMKQYINEKSAAQGLPKSRLPVFTEDWINIIKGTADFLGVNHYTSTLIKHSIKKIEPDVVIDQLFDQDIQQIPYPNIIPSPGVNWLYIVPEGLRNVLNWVSKEYFNVEIMITENGYGSNDSTLNDANRLNYFKKYIHEVWKAIVLDGNNISGYMAWCLMDNFEWIDGYTTKFGIHSVDMKSAQKTRTARASAKFLANVFSRNELGDVN